MKITKMTNDHLKNRIAFFERKLKNAPGVQFYAGNSDCAEDAVEQENRQNERLSEDITNHIKYMKTVARKRGLL